MVFQRGLNWYWRNVVWTQHTWWGRTWWKSYQSSRILERNGLRCYMYLAWVMKYHCIFLPKVSTYLRSISKTTAFKTSLSHAVSSWAQSNQEVLGEGKAVCMRPLWLHFSQPPTNCWTGTGQHYTGPNAQALPQGPWLPSLLHGRKECTWGRDKCMKWQVGQNCAGKPTDYVFPT